MLESDDDLDAVARELLEDPNTHVVCDLAIPIERAQAYLAIGDHSGFNGRMVQVVDGKAYMPLVYDLGDMGDAVFDERSGVFALEGYGPARISWTDPPQDGSKGACTATIEPEPGTASITGMLLLSPSGAPAAGGWIEGCGNMAFADQLGVVHMDIVAEPCTVLAMRRDGLLRTMSEPVAIEPTPGQDVVIDITIPEARRGGLGIQISQTDAGVIVDGLVDGGPATDAGLEAGDRIVAVDGESADDLDLGELVQAIGGDAGTEVAIAVDRAGERLEFTIMRRVLGEDG